MIGKANSTLFTRNVDNDLFICQIFIDDIIFGSTNQSFYGEFSKIITDRFEMSLMGGGGVEVLSCISNQAT
jgi:hypothetical protein